MLAFKSFLALPPESLARVAPIVRGSLHDGARDGTMPCDCSWNGCSLEQEVEFRVMTLTYGEGNLCALYFEIYLLGFVYGEVVLRVESPLL